MATRGKHSNQAVSRGLLTKSEREVLRGEKDDVDEDSYIYNIRTRARKRMNELEDDLELLEEAGEDELVRDFFQRFGKVERLEREIEALEQRLDEQES